MPSKKVTRRASRQATAVKAAKAPGPAVDRALSAESQSQLRQDRTQRVLRDERARQAVLEKQGYCF